MHRSNVAANAIVDISRFSYSETIDKLTAAIGAAGATLFAQIDQSAAAEGAGLTLRPTTLLIYGNPKAGTLLMQAFPLTALDLPLKLLIWEESGTVRVAHLPVKALVSRYDVTGEAQLVDAFEHAVDALLNQIR
jgi:uncharacterized protein (DUF302 family)